MPEHIGARSSTPTRRWATWQPWWRSGHPRPRRTCRSPASPGSRTPTSAWSARTSCWTRFAAAGRRCGPIARVAYRGTQQIDHRTARLAVVVQAMVHSETAGVLFTANPVTGRRREAVIDASPGLGEAVVSGAVTPDHLVVDTATGRMLDSRVGDKGSRSGGARWRHRADRPRPQPTSCASTVEQTREAGQDRRHRRAALRRPAGHRVGVRPGRESCG